MEWYSYDQNSILPTIESHLNNHLKDIASASKVVLDKNLFQKQLYLPDYTNTLFIVHKYVHHRYLIMFTENFSTTVKKKLPTDTYEMVLVKDKGHTYFRNIFLLAPKVMIDKDYVKTMFATKGVFASPEKFIKEWQYYLKIRS